MAMHVLHYAVKVIGTLERLIIYNHYRCSAVPDLKELLVNELEQRMSIDCNTLEGEQKCQIPEIVIAKSDGDGEIFKGIVEMFMQLDM